MEHEAREARKNRTGRYATDQGGPEFEHNGPEYDQGGPEFEHNGPEYDEFLRSIKYTGVIRPNDASQWRDIKQLYRKKAFELHPDKHGDSEESKEKFQKFFNAYERFREMNFPDMKSMPLYWGSTNGFYL
jgi:hypothetical protein